ncbi:MAG: glutathione S-transferase N-terminal domain-containing protein [Pseudomonadota bacterium]
MLTLFHSPMSRSTTMVSAIDEMGLTAEIDIRLTPIRRADGSGGQDPDNPHPDGKVPALVHDGAVITERPAILIYLSELFPQAAAIRPVGHPQRGPFLTWLAYYAGVVEPVLVADAAGLTHPYLSHTFRGPKELAHRMANTLSDGREYLLPDGFSTVDLLMASPFLWMRDALPDDPKVVAWFDRVAARPSVITAAQRDQEDIASLA